MDVDMSVVTGGRSGADRSAVPRWFGFGWRRPSPSLQFGLALTSASLNLSKRSQYYRAAGVRTVSAVGRASARTRYKPSAAGDARPGATADGVKKAIRTVM